MYYPPLPYSEVGVGEALKTMNFKAGFGLENKNDREVSLEGEIESLIPLFKKEVKRVK